MRSHTMAGEPLARPWWTLLLRGLLAIAAGVLFLRQPIAVLPALAVGFGTWALIDGAIALVASITRDGSWNLAFAGVIGIVIGSLVILWPMDALLMLYVLVAIWAMGRGIAEIASGSLEREVDGGRARRGMIALGTLSFVFGLFMLIAPHFGVTAFGVWMGLYAVVLGMALGAVAFALRGAHGARERAPAVAG